MNKYFVAILMIASFLLGMICNGILTYEEKIWRKVPYCREIVGANKK